MDFQEQNALYRRLPFEPAVRENILYNNAARPLGLPVFSADRPGSGREKPLSFA